MIYIDDKVFNITEKEEEFAREYVKTNNQSWAYYKAYWSSDKKRDWSDLKTKRNASKRAYDILKNKKELNKYIKYLREKIADETIADAKEIQQFLTKVMRGDPTVLFYEEKNEIGETLKKVPRYDVEKLDGMKAADILNKMQGNYQEKIDDEININVRIGDEDEE